MNIDFRQTMSSTVRFFKRIQMKTSVPQQAVRSDHISSQINIVDRLIDFIARLPAPYWITYLILFILQSLLSHILSWIDGWIPPYTFNALNIIYPLWFWGPLAIMTYLDSVSLSAVSSFKPLLNGSDEDLQQLKNEFSTMPSRPLLINSIVWLIIYAALNYFARQVFFMEYGLGSLAIVVSLIMGLPAFVIGSSIYYHSIRQLRLIHQTVKKVEHFNLFNLEPVYAFSLVTAKTGIAWIIMLSLTLLFFPLQLATMLTLTMYAMQVILALAAFVLPVWIVHQRLDKEKRRLLAELNQRVELTLKKLHSSLDENKLEEVAQINELIIGFNAEREILNKIPTWPWRPGVFTGFISAIILPIVLFLLQFYIGTWLGG